MSDLTRECLESVGIDDLRAMVRVSLIAHRANGSVMRAGVRMANRRACIRYLLNVAELPAGRRPGMLLARGGARGKEEKSSGR